MEAVPTQYELNPGKFLLILYHYFLKKKHTQILGLTKSKEAIHFKLEISHRKF